MDKNKRNYVDIGFLIFSFVFINAFLKDFLKEIPYVFLFSNLLSIIISGFIFLLVRKQRLWVKVITIIGLFIAVITIVNFMNGTKLSLSKLNGNWHSKDFNFKIKNQQLLMYNGQSNRIFDLELNGDTLELYDYDEIDVLTWKVKKCTDSKLVLVDDRGNNRILFK